MFERISVELDDTQSQLTQLNHDDIN